MSAQQSGAFPKAVLYTSGGSVWAAIPGLCFIEKGYHDEDYELRNVNLLEAENFAPSYLRLNPQGTVPTLVVPLAETTGQEVDTKFRAITNSTEICEFLDASRSQTSLDVKASIGATDSDKPVKPAPILSPATIEGKAASDELIKIVQSPSCDPNGLLLAARSPEELQKQRAGPFGTFCRNRQGACERFQQEARANGSSVENPRTAHDSEKLVQWYVDKLQQLRPLHAVYIDADPQASQVFIQNSVALWHGVHKAFGEIERRIIGPFALGDQLSLADLQVTAWLARVFSIAQNVESEGDEFKALQKAFAHPAVGIHEPAFGEKLTQYWHAMKQRPSFQKVYATGLH